MATATNDKPVRLGDLPVIKTNILENARQYDKGIIGGYNGDFPLTVATKGNIYRVPATNKFYMCITDYNGSNLTAPNANFEELSVWANRDKLENLSIHKIKTITSKVKFGKVLNQGTILFDGTEFNNILKYNKVSFVSLTINSLSLSGTSPFYIPSKRLKYISNDVSREKNESLVLVTFEDSDDNICVYGSFDATKVTAMAINFYTIN